MYQETFQIKVKRNPQFTLCSNSSVDSCQHGLHWKNTDKN